MKIINCKQGTPEWFAARAGKVTASNADRIITPTGKLSAQADGLINEMIAETLMAGAPQGVEQWASKAMQYGIDTEPVARAWYSFSLDVDVEQVGFCVSDCGRFGCSPDGLVGDDGGLELKCPQAQTHIGYLRAGCLPPAYVAQVHHSLIVTGREWWDFVSYCVGLPEFRIRVTPGPYTGQLREALEQFWPQYEAALSMVRGLLPAPVKPAEEPVLF